MPKRILQLYPIGIARTPYKTKYGAPRQPASASQKTVGTITLDEHSNFEQALEDLKGFDFIWVIFWFHKNTNWKPKVLPPHGGRTKRGVFATRSPHRPNPIGLSLCRLLDIKGRTLTIENPDMLDGTPVLDIKPYIPHAESQPNAQAGWIDELNEQSKPAYEVLFTPDVLKSMDDVDLKEKTEILGYVSKTLSHDPLPHVYRRIKESPDGTSIIAVKRWRFVFSMDGTNVRVFGVAHSKDRAKSS